VRLSSDYSEIKIRLKFAPNSVAPNFEPDWNKPPTAPMLVAIRFVNGERVAKDDKLQYSTFNARAEEFTTKPSFRDAWTRGQRCLVITDGFYVWKKRDAKGKLKQPHAIAMIENAQMVMAGLWAKWKAPTSGEEVLSCTILTCEPNNAMGELHDRMPVILAENDWPKWLGEEPTKKQELLALLKPCPDEDLEIWPVDKMVGNVKYNGPQLIMPVLSNVVSA
jgi:putative SOS response-associated peptidase YedK